MRPVFLLLALSALAPGQGALSQTAPKRTAPDQREESKIESGFFPEIREGVAPDERRALIIARAIWDSAAGERFSRGFPRLKARRVGEAWLVTASVDSDRDDVLDGEAYFAFDARDGGLFCASRYQQPKDRDLIELLRRRRASIKRGLE